MRYEAPESLEGAVALLAGAKGEARVLAGGTDLVPNMKRRTQVPAVIIGIRLVGILASALSSAHAKSD